MKKLTIAALFLGLLIMTSALGLSSALEPFALPPSIKNPSLEGAYLEQGAPEVKVAEGWLPWYISEGYWHRPEYVPMEEPYKVYHGERSQKTFTTYAAHDGGIFQIVDGLQTDQWYEFACMVLPMSAGGKSFSVVGVNPWGDAWPEHWTTIWGRPVYNGFDKWHRVSILFQAWSTKAALMTRGRGEWRVKWQDWYWDACTLLEASAPGTPPEPTATPPPGEVVCPSLGEIEDVVRGLLREREPVRWPRD